MRKLSVLFSGILLSLTLAVGIPSASTVVSADETSVYIGGMPAGFTLSAGGAQILGFCEIVTEEGICSPAAAAGLHAGDIITEMAGIRVETVAELNEILAKNKEKPIHVTVCRGSEEFNVEITPVKDRLTDRYKLGILIRDGVSGIGTVTYIEKESGRFGALGHAVAGEERGNLKITNGAVYACSIVGVSKGVRGRAGELRGMFLSEKSIGNADKLSHAGIYGKKTKEYSCAELKEASATSANVKPGKASIYSTVSGETPKEYSVEIVKVDKGNRENKNYVVKITDENLIAQTGGIVQGMSGSPIVQNGNLVGAITHVFVNDPTRGYGIDIAQMLAQ